MNRKFIKVLSFLICIIMLIATVPGTVAMAADKATIDAYAQTLLTYANELNELILQCEKAGKSAEYEKVAYEVIYRWATDELVEPEGDTYYEDFYFTRNPENYFEDYLKPALDKMYNEAKANLNAYLAGTKEPKDVPRYISGDVDIDGFNMIANTKDSEGNIEKRPIYFVGYGAFDTAMNAIPEFNGMGVNAIQNELGPDSIITKGFGWNITDHMADGTVRISDDVYTSAPYSLKFTYNQGIQANVYHDIYKDIKLEAGATYTLTFKVKGTNVNGAEYSYTYGTKGQRAYLPTGTFDWTNYRFRFTTDANSTSFKFWVIMQNYTDALYIDDVYLVKAGSAENLVHNGTFDEYIPKDGGKYHVNTNGTARTHRLLTSAQDNNVAVSLLIQPYYWPEFFKTVYPDMYYVANKGTDKESYQVIRNHPKYAEVMEAYVTEVIKQVKDYKSLNNICITNEPSFRAEYYGDYYKPQWQEWLKQKYSDSLTALNNFYGTSYTSWASVPMSVDTNNVKINADNIGFNRDIHSDWHKWIANIIHKYAPDVPVHAKAQGYMGGGITSGYVKNATDFEHFNEWSDLAGCDYSIEWQGVNNGSHPPLGEVFYYDYLAGVGGKPVINSEDHVHVDSEENFNPYHAIHMAQNVWQGAVHHRIMSCLWVFRKSYNPKSIYYGSQLFRPDTIQQIGEATLDLNRLSYEVSALMNVPEDVAVYYSDATRLSGDDLYTYTTKVYNSYEAMLFNGKKTKIVTDSTMNKLAGCKLLVIPYAYQVPEAVLEHIYDFVQNGGKVIVSDTNVLAKNELNKAHNSSYISSIISSATVLTDENRANLAKKYETYLKSNNLQNIWIVDSQTGERITDVEWTYAKYNNQLLINICNYTTDYKTTKNVKLVVDGKVISGATELRSGDVLGESFTLYSNKPILLSVPDTYTEPVDNLRIAKNGTNVTLSWTSADNNYAGANIYTYTGENLTKVASVSDKTTTISNVSGTKTYLIKAVSSTGNESDANIVTVSDSNVFQISATAQKSGFGVVYNVTASGKTDASGVVCVVLKDKNGNVLDIVSNNAFVKKENTITFSGSLGYENKDAAYIDITVFASDAQKLELSNSIRIDL